MKRAFRTIWGSAGLSWGSILVFVAVALALSQLSWSSQALTLMSFVLIYGTAALGLGFLWGQSGQLNLAHAAIFGVGAYIGSLGNIHGQPFFLCMIAAILSGGVVALVIGLLSLRVQGHYFVILTFAVSQTAVYLAGQWSVIGGLIGLSVANEPAKPLGLDLLDGQDLFIMCILVTGVALIVVCALVRSRWGIILRGIRDNPDVATAMGTPVGLHRVLAFGVSGMLAALGGLLYAYESGFVQPSFFDVQLSIAFVLMAVLGGRAYLFGPIIGAVAYVFLPQAAPFSALVSQMLFGAILVLIILFAPRGIGGLVWQTSSWFTAKFGERYSGQPAGRSVKRPSTVLARPFRESSETGRKVTARDE